ncbi:WD40-repeat-containing domain protein [Radiomyces spectabilis]|uniref:WD40-repeat-containing domain protein n=1 Tax=Radiomyces spectabilis TaxID=64574 RepID=UPI00221E8CDC|nr:WD40-repeat-containing domain protein [Radiomyces spectabilis]KAI8388883.1 WD40-repeat-containing domain protein [Radiomyces spectabilis]
MATSSTAPPPPTPSYIFRGHTAAVNSVRFFDHNKYFVSGDADGVIFVWKLRTRRPVLTWKAHEESCLSVNLIGNDKLLSQGRDNSIHVWQLPCLETDSKEIPKKLSTIVYDSLNFCKLCVCNIKDNDTLLCFPSLGDTSLVDIYSLQEQRWIIRGIGNADAEDKKAATGICMAVRILLLEDTVHIVSGYEDGSVVLWRIKENNVQCIWRNKYHKEPVLDLAVDPLKSFIYSTSADNQVIRHDVHSGKHHIVPTKKSGVAAVAIREDNKILATAGYDGKIRIFSIKSQKPLAVLSYHQDSVYALDFAELTKEHYMLSGGKDNRIALWSIY